MTTDRLVPTILLTTGSVFSLNVIAASDWRIRIVLDPGTVIVATPPRYTPPAQQPSEAPVAPEDGEDG